MADPINDDLVGRLSAAERGSVEMDGLLWEALTGETPAHPFGFDDGPYVVYGNGLWEPLSPFTTSLDAALALAERVLGELKAMCLLEDVVQSALDYGGVSIGELPRILCIAIIKARPTAGTDSHEGEGR